MSESAPAESGNVIVVGIDDSEEAQAAARYAVHLAQGFEGEILLAHAYEPWPVEVADYVEDESQLSTEQSAKRLVDRVAAELHTASAVPIRTAVGGERPGPFLARLANEARLVVVGQDTARLLERLSFGSVAAHLAGVAPCPVVIVPAGWHPRPFGYHPVVVALSGEEPAPRAMAMAFDEAERSGTGVLALHAVPYFSSAEDLAQHERELSETVRAASRQRPGVDVQTLVLRGAPDEHLVRQSVNATAAVVGRSHRQGVTPWMRSVAHSVVKRAHCPLFVVPTT